MEQLNNPFVIYGYKGAEYFCDRKKETKTIVEALENERNVVLMSPRRIGKTGLIHHVFENIQDADSAVKCFYMDINATRSMEQFVQLLGKDGDWKGRHVLTVGNAKDKRIFRQLQAGNVV